jgi:hypothetical protein
MKKDCRSSGSSRELRSLNTPRPIRVTSGAGGRPLFLHLKGKAWRVQEILDIWQIDDEWWRSRISRRYATLLLEDGRRMTVYRDLVDGAWYLQEG